MSTLDRTKEELAYSRFWQGIVVVTDVSLIGWSFASFGSAPVLTFALATIGVLFLTTVAIALDRYIRRAGKAIEMETILAILMFIVILVIGGIPLHFIYVSNKRRKASEDT